MNGGRNIGTHIVSLSVIAVGIGALVTSLSIPTMPNFALVGPRAVPFAVSILLIALGLFLLRNALKGGWECEATDPALAPPDLQPLAYVGLGLLLNLVLIGTVGFILASTVMFICVAKGFGSRRLWFAALVGFLLALAAYYGFAQLLGLRMGSGLIEDLI